jgi:hypothetical protein
MTKRLVLLAATAAALAAPAGATAGGWATVGLDSLPDGVAPGEPWTVELTILQHGRTPLEGVRPSVIVEKAGEETTRSFPARETDEPGVYRVTVVFASAGTWSYMVDDGFSATHTYGPVEIRAAGDGASAAGEGDDGGEAAASGGEAAGGRGIAPAAREPAGRGQAAAPVDDGPDWLLALAAAAVAGLAAGLGAAALQRRREGPAPASG